MTLMIFLLMRLKVNLKEIDIDGINFVLFIVQTFKVKLIHETVIVDPEKVQVTMDVALASVWTPTWLP